MKVNLIMVDECGDEVIAETINETQVQALGNCLDGYIQLRIGQLEEQFAECQYIYREDVKSYGEQIADQWEEIYQEELEWALAHEDELDEDPYEYAQDMADSYFDDPYKFYG